MFGISKAPYPTKLKGIPDLDTLSNYADVVTMFLEMYPDEWENIGISIGKADELIAIVTKYIKNYGTIHGIRYINLTSIGNWA